MSCGWLVGEGWGWGGRYHGQIVSRVNVMVDL